ncbi:hypothetical protein ACQR16_00265 [Bradyrhizobium oligotrophicum]|uniref:hypothetical protein n=1 Tax=Bradyrhizobium oligotrophicum TaxID=44255 RepID=UPI003EB7B542
MNELIEPLARMAGIDRAVAEKPRHLLTIHLVFNVPFNLPCNVSCNKEPQQQFANLPTAANERSALELSGLSQDQIGTDQMGTMRPGTRGLNQFA